MSTTTITSMMTNPMFIKFIDALVEAKVEEHMKGMRREPVVSTSRTEKAVKGKNGKTVFKEQHIDDVKAEIQNENDDIDEKELNKLVSARLEEMWDALDSDEKKEYKGSRQARTPKDENRPKKAPSAYIQFLSQALEELKEQYPDMPQKERMKMGAEMWKQSKGQQSDSEPSKKTKKVSKKAESESEDEDDEEPIVKAPKKSIATKTTFKAPKKAETDSESEDDEPVKKAVAKVMATKPIATKPKAPPKKTEPESESEDEEPVVKAPKKPIATKSTTKAPVAETKKADTKVSETKKSKPAPEPEPESDTEEVALTSETVIDEDGEKVECGVDEDGIAYDTEGARIGRVIVQSSGKKILMRDDEDDE